MALAMEGAEAMAQPTIHVTNAASRKFHGPGRLLHIMVFPPKWLEHQGAVEELRPDYGDFQAYRQGNMTLSDYRRSFEEGLQGRDLRPGVLTACDPVKVAFGAPARLWVSDGDTLVCTCSKDLARANACHRCWSAVALKAAGWRVILDGVEL